MCISEVVEYVKNPDNHTFLTLIITSISLALTIFIKPIYRVLNGCQQAQYIRKIVRARLSILSDDTLPENTKHSDFQYKLESALQGMTFDLKAALADYSSNLSPNKKRDIRRLCNNIEKVIIYQVYPGNPFAPEHLVGYSPENRSTQRYRNLVAKELWAIKWIKIKWVRGSVDIMNENKYG